MLRTAQKKMPASSIPSKALEKSLVQHLHHRVLAQGAHSLREAQAHAIGLIASRLPGLACDFLEVGLGPGVGVCHRLGETAPVTCVSLEHLTTETRFDCIVFQVADTAADPLDLFNKSAHLLKPAGQVLVLGEFAQRHVSESDDGLWLVEDFKALSSRFGFGLVEQLDLSAQAMSSLDNWLQKTTGREREQTSRAFGITPDEVDQLGAMYQEQRNEYTDGRRQYILMQLKKGKAPRWRLSRVDDSNKTEILTLFEQSFGYQINPALWHWKYGAGRGVQMGVWADQQLVAHYGGMPRAIHFFGVPRSAIQIGDVMVLGSERGVLTRSGPFFLMASSFLERYIGLGKPFLMGFGFPQERAMRLAERLGLYTEVGKMVEMVWAPLPKTPRWLTRLVRVTSADISAHQQIDKLWLEMAADLSHAIVGVRDWAHLRHRYFEHPSNTYEVYLVRQRLSGRGVGVVVLKRTHERCELVDLVAPLRAIPELVVHARRLTGLGHSTQLQCGITENFCSVFSDQEGRRQEMDIRIPTSIWGKVPDPKSIENRWWLMLGDTDFR